MNAEHRAMQVLGGGRTRGLALAGASILALVLGGCGGPGRYTTEKAAAAKEAQDIRKAATEWQQAEQAYLAGDLDKALKLVDRSIAVKSAVPKSWTLKGRILLEMNNLDGAAASLEKAIALDPTFSDASYYLGIVMERFSQSERALGYYSRAAEIDPSNAQYMLAAAEMYIDLGQYEQAETYLRTRSGSFEHNAGVRQTLGHLAMIKGDAAAGAKLFEEARLLAPDDKAIMEDLIRAQVATSQFAEAEFNLSRLLLGEEAEKRRDLQHMRVRCLVEVDRLLEARELAIKLTQGPAGQADVDAWIDLGNISYLLNDLTRARQAAARVMSIAPDRTDGYVLNALQLRRNGNFKQALGFLQKANSIKARSQTYVAMALVYQDMNRPADARRCLEEAVRLDPGDGAAVHMLAQVTEE